jgi:hypothetical protein
MDDVKWKRCSSCEETKDVHNFGIDKARKDGISIYCFPCRRKMTSKWRKTPRGKIRPDKSYNANATLKYEYGITLDRYNEMLSIQHGTCAICNSPPTYRRLDVDHCHHTGKVRGLLCKRCNTGLGNFRDNVELVQIALDYLKFPKDWRVTNLP